MFKTIIGSALIATAIVGAYFIGVRTGRDMEFLRIMEKMSPARVTRYVLMYENKEAEAMMRMAKKILDWISEDDDADV